LTAAALGHAYTLSGRLAEAVPLLEEAVERATPLFGVGLQSLRVGWFSEAYEHLAEPSFGQKGSSSIGVFPLEVVRVRRLELGIHI
jgi:hypothetical protein